MIRASFECVGHSSDISHQTHQSANGYCFRFPVVGGYFRGCGGMFRACLQHCACRRSRGVRHQTTSGLASDRWHIGCRRPRIGAAIRNRQNRLPWRARTGGLVWRHRRTGRPYRHGGSSKPGKRRGCSGAGLHGPKGLYFGSGRDGGSEVARASRYRGGKSPPRSGSDHPAADSGKAHRRQAETEAAAISGLNDRLRRSGFHRRRHLNENGLDRPLGLWRRFLRATGLPQFGGLRLPVLRRNATGISR